MTAERLSALDASFLTVEGPDTPMHVGWVARFDGDPPPFAELFAHLAGRLELALRFRQILAPVPLGLHEPVWVHDPSFDPSRHLRHAPGDDLGPLVDDVLSTPLPRDRPLWEIWIADGLEDGLALVAKMHHCMVDGTAIAELGRLILDTGTPREPDAAAPANGTAPADVSAGRLVADAVRDRAGDAATVALAPLQLRSALRAAPRLARTAAHTALPPAPASPLNRPGGTARRHHVRVTRAVGELRTVRRRFGVTPNDVVLSACAGALRRFAERRGDEPQRLKIMVPADVRSSADATAAGNRISFLFMELPCHEPDPIARLQAIAGATAQRRGDGEAETVDAALRALALSPRPIRQALAHAFAHPRLFNLTISSVPGPTGPRYLHGCRLREVHSAVPLSGRHALSIGIVVVAGRVCFGIYADAVTLPDAEDLHDDLHAAMDELVALAAD